MRLPDFLVIGAAKSGTTALYEALRQHPEIYMPETKELHFFSFGLAPPSPDGRPSCQPEERYARPVIRNLEEYGAFFTAAGPERKALGEASPGYLAHPGTAERIHAHLPRVKLIALLRHPVAAAFSAYQMNVRAGRESAPDFVTALREDLSGRRDGWSVGRYVERRRYHAMLEPYWRLFGPEQLRVYLFEDWRTKPAEVLREIFRFLGVDEGFTPRPVGEVNPGGLPQRPGLHALVRQRGLRRLARSLLPGSLYRAVRDAYRRHFYRKPPLPSEARELILAAVRDDVLRLQERLGRDLSPWLK